jgi:serine phosphatase RsbU (regulator of sigma subunit)
MPLRKIHHKILVLLTLVLVFALGLTLWIVRTSVSRQVQGELLIGLDARFALISNWLKAGETSMRKQVLLLSEEPTLKMSLETGDGATVKDTARQLQSMIQNDFFLITDDKGLNLAQLPDSGSFYKTVSESAVIQALNGGLIADLWPRKGGVDLAVSHGVSFHDFLVGTVTCGFSLDHSLALSLALQSQSRVSFFLNDKRLASSWGLLGSHPYCGHCDRFFRKTAGLGSCPTCRGELLLLGAEDDGWLKEIQNIDGTLWMGKLYPVNGYSRKFSILLQGDYSRALEDLDIISRNLLLLGLAILSIAFLLSYRFSRQMTRPIDALVDATGKVATGDFDTSVEVVSNDELGVLGASFEIMRQSLIEQRKELVRTEAMKKDLELAGRIQTSLLPKQVPKLDGMEITCRLIPSNQIGGDYYGFFEVQQGGFGCVIADVSGHGAAAALLMAMARSVLLSKSPALEEPHHILKETNDALYADLEEAESFISMFYWTYTPETRMITYANAGHNQPLHYRVTQGDFVSLDTEGMMIGILEGGSYEKKQTTVEPGDILVFYTDGLIEARDSDGEEFGMDRFKESVLWAVDHGPNLAIEKLYKSVEDFAGQGAWGDDRTCVLVRMQGEEGVRGRRD